MFDLVDMFILFSFGFLSGVLFVYIKKENARVEIAFLVWGTLLLVNTIYLSYKHLT